MSLKILKAGILDSIQDDGRHGYQHLGINCNGAMDAVAMQTANLLVGNELNEPVIEVFYPAPEILFESNAMVAITGANFSPMINGDKVKTRRSLLVKKNSVIQFPKKKRGQCCYIAVHKGFKLSPWLNSYSTNLKAEIGGYEGRRLKKDDHLEFNYNFKNELLKENDLVKLPWRAILLNDDSPPSEIFVLTGNEWNKLTKESKSIFLNKEFALSVSSDRMGYALTGESLFPENKEELVSSAVNFGTIQLLPNGQMIILMADSQTAGGYPRIAHVISAHRSKIAQKQPGETIKFTIVDQAKAEELLLNQHLHLQQLKNGCKFKLLEFFK